jgi:hypothetical protein
VPSLWRLESLRSRIPYAESKGNGGGKDGGYKGYFGKGGKDYGNGGKDLGKGGFKGSFATSSVTVQRHARTSSERTWTSGR